MQAALGGGGAIEQEHRLQANDLPFEFMLNALRLVDGVPTSMFTERTGLPLAAMARALRVAGEAGLLDPDPALLRATPLGLRFLNDLQEKFLEET